MKSRTTTIFITFAFGGMGFHKFYLGEAKKGVLYLLFFWTGVPHLIAFIEMLIFIGMSEKDFNLCYNSFLSTKPSDADNFDHQWSLKIMQHRKQLLPFYWSKISFPHPPYHPKTITLYINEVRPYLAKSRFYKRFVLITLTGFMMMVWIRLFLRLKELSSIPLPS